LTNKSAFVVGSLCIFLSFGAGAQTERDLSRATHEAVTRLAGSILVDGRAYDYDKELADAIGPRLTGSDAYNRAVEWASAQFRDLGLTSVQAEGFPTFKPVGARQPSCRTHAYATRAGVALSLRLGGVLNPERWRQRNSFFTFLTWVLPTN